MADERRFASRAGLKLAHGLHELGVDVNGLTCADFGCNVGGFTDCLLQHGATRVYAVDTGYGTLDYRLRRDERVVTMERTNALHADPPEGGVDLVTIDLAWTPQRHAIPAALRWLRPRGVIISLIKPHYELSEQQKRELLTDGHLAPEHAETVMRAVLDAMSGLGARVHAHCRSPLAGGKSSARRRGGGNVEYLALLGPI